MGKLSDQFLTADGEDTGMTHTLRILAERTTGTLKTTVGTTVYRKALLICSDSSSEKWGRRWFGQSGFEIEILTDPNAALGAVREMRPDIVVAEAWAKTDGGELVFKSIQEAADVDIPVFVLCGSTQQVSAAIDADVCEVARKPFDWQLLARRAKQICERIGRERELEETRESLKSALEVANQARKKLRHTETFEPVTGLPNRNKFVELVNKGVRASQRDGNCLAVYIVAFNRFRLILEALGRSEVNNAVAELGKRLDACVRAAIDSNRQLTGLKTAAIATVGTGRFGIMLTCSEEGIERDTLRREIAQAMSKPAKIAGQTIYLTTSVGGAIAPADSLDAEALLIKAESAMRDAKARGVDFRYFCSDMDAAANRRLQIEQMLHTAMEKRELKIAYQPIIDTMTDRIAAVEALLRWPQPDGSFIGPDEFVPIAEDAGLMNKIGEFVVDGACRQIRDWGKAGLGSVRVAVNVARSQLLDPDFPDVVMRSIQTYGIKPDCLDLELSERGILSHNAEITDQLRRLKSLGVTISLDDFGTGDSSIAYLKDMPVDALKIDRSYIATLPVEGRESRMIAAIIALAKQLDLVVIAEGVETSPQLNILQSMGCDQYQGFLRSPAVPADEILRLASQTGT